MGPISDEAQLERVMRFVEIGKREGRLACGGARLHGPRYDRGLFVAPTIFDGVAPGHQVADEEIFGPVLSVIRVADADAAIETANRNRFGMVAAIFSRSLHAVMHAADALECGTVHINAPTIGAEVHLPFGGIKDAGVGTRELGSCAIDFYTESKVVFVNHAG
jgi:aldehyde dehydrogenase (NAD+)